MRWTTGETRRAVFWLASNTDVAATGLAPTVTARRVSDGAALAAPAATEVGDGFYSFAFTAPSSDSFVFLVDGGAALDAAHRYVPLEVPAGGYVDNADVATSTRSSAVDAATLLARLTATRAGALDLLDAATSTRATTAQLSTVQLLVDDLETRLSAARALLLDNLDAAVSSRATAASLVRGHSEIA